MENKELMSMLEYEVKRTKKVHLPGIGKTPIHVRISRERL